MIRFFLLIFAVAVSAAWFSTVPCDGHIKNNQYEFETINVGSGFTRKENKEVVCYSWGSSVLQCKFK